VSSCGVAELLGAVTNVKASITDVQTRIATLDAKVNALITDVSASLRGTCHVRSRILLFHITQQLIS
jgi:hypothetical protein